MRPKLVALMLAAALTTGWLLASIVSPPVAELQVLPQRTVRPASSRDAPVDARFIERLNLRLQSASTAPVTRRNPFVFGSAPRRIDRETTGGSATLLPREEAPPAPSVAGPSLRLSGIGTTTTDAGAVRTAIISDGRTVYLAKLGETVTGYVVVAITDDTVTIEDAAGKSWILRLK